MNLQKVNSLKLDEAAYPDTLRYITHPPKQLFYTGSPPSDWSDKPRLAVVGSRKISPYGRQVTEDLISQLARSGVVIISGLAYGVDAAAHQAALDVDGITVAVLPGGVDTIFPAGHGALAQAILQNNGTILSEYPERTVAYKQNFVARNRIVAGLADAVLITEAAVNSGALHTARFALETGRTVMAIPGNITSPTSAGCNNLIKSGAVAVTNVEDIFFALGLKLIAPKQHRPFRGTEQEQVVLDLIAKGVKDQEELAVAADLDGAAVTAILTILEISGHIRSMGAGNWVIV